MSHTSVLTLCHCRVCIWHKAKGVVASWEIIITFKAKFIRHPPLNRKCFRHSRVSLCTNWAWAGWLMTVFHWLTLFTCAHVCVWTCICTWTHTHTHALHCRFASELSRLNIVVHKCTQSVTPLSEHTPLHTLHPTIYFYIHAPTHRHTHTHSTSGQ